MEQDAQQLVLAAVLCQHDQDDVFVRDVPDDALPTDDLKTLVSYYQTIVAIKQQDANTCAKYTRCRDADPCKGELTLHPFSPRDVAAEGYSKQTDEKKHQSLPPRLFDRVSGHWIERAVVRHRTSSVLQLLKAVPADGRVLTSAPPAS